MNKIKEYIFKLQNQIKYWNVCYNAGISSIPDSEYDKRLLELKKLKAQYPAFFLKKNFIFSNQKNLSSTQIYHPTPMLSLNSVFKEIDFDNFDKKIHNNLKHNSDILYCCELKLDGLAINLVYENGNLIQASTRGNGIVGENIINNVNTIKTIPLFLTNLNNIPTFLEIRGEILLSKNNFLKLNRILIKKNKKTFSNPRNAAVGLLLNKNDPFSFRKFLNFYCHSIASIKTTQTIPNSYFTMLTLMSTLGIPVASYNSLCLGKSQVLNFYQYINQVRPKLAFDIDGIVVKIDSIKFQQKLGVTTHAPRWAIAYKFEAQEKITELKKVNFQIGRTGILTPVAKLVPIYISGVKINSVNLHNINEIKRLKLMIGNTVIVRRSGDVIPKITGVITTKSNAIKKIIIPSKCPVCYARIKIKPQLHCVNGLRCNAQLKAYLKHFISKEAMNIHGIGNKIITKLVDQKLVQTPVDLFKLNQSDFLKIKNINIKSAQNLIFAIEKSKKTNFASFLYALGIQNVGKIIAINIAKVFININNLMFTEINTLTSTPGIGKITAIHIKNFFQQKNNIKMINELATILIKIN